jgi:SAM-dependent methyltransferase
MCQALVLVVYFFAASESPHERFALRRLTVRSQPSPFARAMVTIAAGERVETDGETAVDAHDTSLSWLHVKVVETAQVPTNRRASLRWGWVDATGAESRDEQRERRFASNYGRAAVQREMVLDDARTAAYARAVDVHAVHFRNAVVLDVGCGSGVLSVFAARAGARHVYCVEKAPGAAAIARAMVVRNNFESIITVVELDIDSEGEADLIPTVDIIISEWMGYLGLVEGMLATVLAARDRYLKPGGLLFPDAFTLRAAGTTAVAPQDLRSAMRSEREAALAARSARYDIDLSALNDAAVLRSDSHSRAGAADAAGATAPPRRALRNKPIYVTDVPMATVCTSSAVLLRVNLATVSARSLLVPPPPSPHATDAAPDAATDAATDAAPVRSRRSLRRINGSFEMHTRGGRVSAACVPTAIALWWSVVFRAAPFAPRDGGEDLAACRALHGREAGDVVELDTSPFSVATHWKQSLVVLPAQSGRRAGGALRGAFCIGPDEADTWGRSFTLELTLADPDGDRQATQTTQPLRYKIPSAFDTY